MLVFRIDISLAMTVTIATLPRCAHLFMNDDAARQRVGRRLIRHHRDIGKLRHQHTTMLNRKSPEPSK